MATFLQKLRTVTLGTAHDLLDKAIDLNSPSALRQYVRDLEDALDKMRSEAATQAGSVRTMTREKGDLETSINTRTQTIARIQAGTLRGDARSEAVVVVRLQDQLKQKIADLAVQTKTAEQIDATVRKMEAKHDEMVVRVRELERIDRDTKMKEQSARAVAAASSLTGTGAGIAVDDVESKMRARNDVASEKFERAMGDIHVGEEDADTASKVDDLLASLNPPEKKTA